MRIQFLSDLHIEFEDFIYEENDFDVVILAGDIHVKGHGVRWAKHNIQDKPVLYVPGNHEFYGKAYPKHIDTLKEEAAGSNVHILERDTLEIDGVFFLGCTLWTDFELHGDPRITGHECQQLMNDYKKIRVSPNYSKLRSIDVANIHRSSRQWLETELDKLKNEKVVVITHHGPSMSSLPDFRREEVHSAAYVSNLDGLIKQFSPSYWVHGHLHNSSDYEIEGCRVVCNPRGYPEEPNNSFDQEKHIEI